MAMIVAAAAAASPAVFSGHHYLTHLQAECHHVHKRARYEALCVLALLSFVRSAGTCALACASSALSS
jgi:hypothetical protein